LDILEESIWCSSQQFLRVELFNFQSSELVSKRIGEIGYVISPQSNSDRAWNLELEKGQCEKM